MSTGSLLDESLGPDHHVWLAGIEQFLFGQDEIAAVVVCQRKLMPKHDRLGRARLLAVAAEDAAQQVDFVHLGIAFAGRGRMAGIVLRRLDIDGSGLSIIHI